MNNLSLLVMAAGMGSRYGGLKQLDSFGPNNETIIDYSVYDAIESGFEKVVFIIREEFSKDFKTKISDKFKDKINVEHVYQSLDQVPKSFSVPNIRKKPWGTGQAILSAKKAISGPFMAINGDDFYGRQSFQIASNFYQNEENKFCMVSFKLENTLSEFGGVSRGVCNSFNRQLVSVKETHNIEKKDDEIRWLVALISDTGMRLGEAVGLLKSDIKLDSKIPYIELKPHSWRSLKTKGSERNIPIIGSSLWACKKILESNNDSIF